MHALSLDQDLHCFQINIIKPLLATANYMDTDQTSHSVPSSLGLWCLQIFANYSTEWIIRLLLFMTYRVLYGHGSDIAFSAV